MKNWFEKEYKWMAAVIFVITACTACGKENAEQKMMISVLEAEYINDYWNNGIQFLHFQISDALKMAEEQSDDLAEKETETVKADEKSTEDDAVISKAEEESNEKEWDVDFEIVREGYIYYEQRNEIDIYYPQLSGFADPEKENRINALIEEDVKKIIGEKNKEGDDSLYCISLDYEIKFLNERVISILYEGMRGYITPGRGLNAEAIATTIDMEKEKVITVKDVVTDFTELRDMLLADEFEHITRWEGNAGGYQVSWDYRGFEDELEKDLQKEQKWYTDGEHFVIITKGLVDYNEYSISNESVKHILDAEFLKKLEPSENDYCSISDFENFHYYLFCNTNIGTTALDNPTVNAFIGNDAETSEAGVELYQKFMEPLWAIDHGKYMELRYLSPDGQLGITLEGEEGNALLWRWRFFEGEKEKDCQEEDVRYNTDSPFRIIKSGDTYSVVTEETFDKKAKGLDDEMGYYHLIFNEQGNLGVGKRYDSSHDTWELSICDLESAEVLWTIYQGNEYNYVYQIQGDKESGKVVCQLSYRDFYEYTYPSGEISYLGKDMYYACYSPDGKYMAYSSPHGEACYDLDEEEAEEVTRILPGIYILEVETGKTAYIKQDIDGIEWADRLDSRSFMWVEKDSFEQIMEKRK